MIIGLAVLLGACAYKQREIYNVDRPIPEAASRLSLDRLEQQIRAAGSRRDWRMTRQGPGHLVATQTAPKHSATVDITFDQRAFRITYRDSSNLNAQDGRIHAHYNFWVRNLEADIYERLSAVQ
jgi:hypothetical protein